MGRIKRSGYWYVLKRDHPQSGKQGYIAEHRLVMEKHLGRYLEKSEVVHHVDHNITNNSIINLKLYSSHGQHTKHAHPEVYEKARKVSLGRKPINYAQTEHTCKQCSNRFMENPNRKKRFCSHPCYGLSKKGMKPTKKQLESLELGRGWNKGLPMTWNNRPKVTSVSVGVTSSSRIF